MLLSPLQLVGRAAREALLEGRDRAAGLARILLFPSCRSILVEVFQESALRHKQPFHNRSLRESIGADYPLASLRSFRDLFTVVSSNSLRFRCAVLRENSARCGEGFL